MEKLDQIALRDKSINLALGINAGTTKLAQIEMSLQIKDTIGKPILRSAFKGKEQVSFTAIKTLVVRFMDSFGFSTKMNDTQVEILAVDTFENFSYESIEDVILFFKMARSGKFGTTGRGVDSNLIFGTWFPMYLEIKARAREEEYTKSKTDRNSDRRGSSIDEVISTYKSHANRSEKVMAETYIDEMIKDFDRQMLEDTITDWSKDDYKKQFVPILKSKRKKV